MGVLTLNDATVIVDEALAEGARRDMHPLCVVVLDAAGRPLVIKRDERASIGRSAIATGKASGCLEMGLGGRELHRRSQTMPGFFTALSGIFPNGIVPVPGGVLIRNQQDELIGAVGVSGDKSDNDEICALAGIAAAGLRADTGA